MRIRIGQVFRVAHSSGLPGSPESMTTYAALTRGAHSSGADIQKGIWAYKSVRETGHKFMRVPAVVLHSNPFKEGTEATPWVDIIEPGEGYAIYNGDNHHSERRPLESRGNALLDRLMVFYEDPVLRRFAPPVLLFRQHHGGSPRRGFREFSGYGIPVEYRLTSQREKGTDRFFTNLVAELVLFGLEVENEQFDWAWIDARRDARTSAVDALKKAPYAWRTWVEEGATAIERCRRRIARHGVRGTVEQRPQLDSDSELLKKIEEHFKTTPHAFEGLSSLIATRVIGTACQRGWVTQRSGDGGVDFVCRLDLGSEFSRVRVVVLGQAKCQQSVSGKDLARLVARLQRGWIGVFVTTGTFSRAAQEELAIDRYPVILINGARLAREVRLLLNAEGIPLAQLLERERHWYDAHLEPIRPERILVDDFDGPGLGELPASGSPRADVDPALQDKRSGRSARIKVEAPIRE